MRVRSILALGAALSMSLAVAPASAAPVSSGPAHPMPVSRVAAPAAPAQHGPTARLVTTFDTGPAGAFAESMASVFSMLTGREFQIKSAPGDLLETAAVAALHELGVQVVMLSEPLTSASDRARAAFQVRWEIMSMSPRRECGVVIRTC